MSSFCAYFNQGLCRSCEWIGLSYAQQLTQKERSVHASLSFFEPFVLEKTTQSEPQGFRNKAKMSVTGTVDAPIIGLVGEKNLDQGRELLACPIHHPKLNSLIASLPEWIQKLRLFPYSIETRKGELKGFIAFYSPLSDQMYLRFILRSKEGVSRILKGIPSLQSQFPSLVCITANIQPIPHAVLEGPEEIFLTAKKTIDHWIGGLRLQLAPQAFVQTNTLVATQLYETAAQWIREIQPVEGPRIRLLELYAGQGAFSFFAAQSAGEILGIEIHPDAVKTANETARDLGLTGVSFKQSDATKVEQEVALFSPDVILVNPPRRGLGKGVDLIRAQLPAHFFYSSCSIETLSADLQKLSDLYRLKRVQIFDLFSHTRHFETLVWLERI